MARGAWESTPLQVATKSSTVVSRWVCSECLLLWYILLWGWKCCWMEIRVWDWMAATWDGKSNDNDGGTGGKCPSWMDFCFHTLCTLYYGAFCTRGPNETEKNCFHSRRNNFYITIAIICNSESGPPLLLLFSLVVQQQHSYVIVSCPIFVGRLFIRRSLLNLLAW